MKKLLTIFCLILSFASFGQAVVTRTNGTTTPLDVRLMAGQNLFIPRFLDTANANTNRGVDSAGAIIFTYTDNGIWYRGNNPKAWLKVGSGSIVNDSVYVKPPLYVYIDSLGHQVIAILQQDGLISGGIVTWSGQGLIFNISPATYVIGGVYYSSPATLDTLSPADPTNPRYDLFVVNTLNQATHITGTPAPSPVVPQPQIGSQLSLTNGLIVNPGDTIPSTITSTIIYNEPPVGWQTGTQAAASTVNFSNTDNPYRGTKDIFISKYNNGSQLYWIDSPFVHNYPTSDGLISGWIYLNGGLPSGNNFYISFVSFDTLTGTPILLNSDVGFDRNDSNNYQQFVIPFSKVTWVNGTPRFTTIELTTTGTDTSGAKGFYMDYMTLQQGIPNIPQPTFQDSNHVSNDSLFWCKKGICYYLGQVNGSGGGGSGISKLGSPAYGLTKTNDSTYIADTTVIMPRSDSTAGGYYPYSSNPLGYLTSIDTTNIPNFSVKVRSLFSATSPITYSNGNYSLDTNIVHSSAYNDGRYLQNITGLVTQGTNVTITGSGTNGSPYVINSSGTSVTTADSILVYSASSSFTFSSVPATYSDYLIFRNEVPLESTTDYTTSGNVVTILLPLVSGDRIRYHRTK